MNFRSVTFPVTSTNSKHARYTFNSFGGTTTTIITERSCAIYPAIYPDYHGAAAGETIRCVFASCLEVRLPRGGARVVFTNKYRRKQERFTHRLRRSLRPPSSPRRRRRCCVPRAGSGTGSRAPTPRATAPTPSATPLHRLVVTCVVCETWRVIPVY